MALVPLRNGHFRSFPCFSVFSRVSSNSGGPSLPSGPFPPEWRKPSEYASLRLFASWDHWVPLDPSWDPGSEALLLAA